MDDRELLSLLRAAIIRRDVEVILDIRRQHHVDSPLYRVSDSSWAVYAMMAAVAVITYFFGWPAGGAALVICGLIYTFVIRRMVAGLMRRRLATGVLMNVDDFRKMWRLKGVGLCHLPSGTLCESPDGLWRSFILERCAPPVDAHQSTT